MLFFARSRELAGTSEAAVALPEGATTIELLAHLLQKVGTADRSLSAAEPHRAHHVSASPPAISRPDRRPSVHPPTHPPSA